MRAGALRSRWILPKANFRRLLPGWLFLRRPPPAPPLPRRDRVLVRPQPVAQHFSSAKGWWPHKAVSSRLAPLVAMVQSAHARLLRQFSAVERLQTGNDEGQSGRRGFRPRSWYMASCLRRKRFSAANVRRGRRKSQKSVARSASSRYMKLSPFMAARIMPRPITSTRAGSPVYTLSVGSSICGAVVNRCARRTSKSFMAGQGRGDRRQEQACPTTCFQGRRWNSPRTGQASCCDAAHLGPRPLPRRP